jgi:membrane-associated phospholipid phosphatase
MGYGFATEVHTAGQCIFATVFPSLRCSLRYGVWLTIEWIAVYGGANWLTGLHDVRVRLHTRFDLQIPFVPEAALVYLSLFPMLWLSPFVLDAPQRLRSFAKRLALLITLSSIGFLILPAERIQVTRSVSGLAEAVFWFADWINLSHNYLPSLHVGMAVVAAHAFSQCARPMVKIFWWLWAAAIALSTLVTRQHYIVDVVTGAALAILICSTKWRTTDEHPLDPVGGDRADNCRGTCRGPRTTEELSAGL